MSFVEFAHHNHAHCIARTLSRVEATCTARGLHLTPVRRRVLEILLNRHNALGAYDILDILRTEGLGSQPPVVYRALEFLTKHGFAHRIERLNAFAACHHPGADHAPAFLICRQCDVVAEIWGHGIRDAMHRTAQTIGFTIERMVLEVEGVCPNCQDGVAP